MQANVPQPAADDDDGDDADDDHHAPRDLDVDTIFADFVDWVTSGTVDVGRGVPSSETKERNSDSEKIWINKVGLTPIRI